MADVSEEIMKRNKLESDDVAWLVPHQANKRIIDATARRMGVGDNKVMLNIEKIWKHNKWNYSIVFMGMGKSIKERRQYYTCCVWRRIYMGIYISEMGMYDSNK